jgi:molybdenum cofactor cytidylyltransferase
MNSKICRVLFTLHRLAGTQWKIPALDVNQPRMPIHPQHVACILLAAGRSERFGGDDKLLSDLFGKPLVIHAATALRALPFQHRIIVGSSAVIDLNIEGFGSVKREFAGAPQSRSIALGVEAAMKLGCDAIMVALADMPFIPQSHFAALMAAFSGSGSIIASQSGQAIMPPALFGQQHFEALAGLSGDQGARALLERAETISLPSGADIDIDTQDDLARLKEKNDDPSASE